MTSVSTYNFIGLTEVQRGILVPQQTSPLKPEQWEEWKDSQEIYQPQGDKTALCTFPDKFQTVLCYQVTHGVSFISVWRTSFSTSGPEVMNALHFTVTGKITVCLQSWRCFLSGKLFFSQCCEIGIVQKAGRNGWGGWKRKEKNDLKKDGMETKLCK